jgi:ADP-heptose:LPS heptosyltransferase
LAPEEIAGARAQAGCIAVQSSGSAARLPMANKQWPVERFQRVVEDGVRHGWRFVQVGSAGDPPLAGAMDLRGRTALREAAAVLHQARLFVGMPGFLMHLARAVDCPAVIVYGGREPPELTGYICNVNLAHRPACAPCWQRNRCEFQRICLEAIPVQAVGAAITTALTRPREPLAVEEVVL